MYVSSFVFTYAKLPFPSNAMSSTRPPQHPVSWQPSLDGTRLLGHMILQKNFKDANFPLLAGSASASSSSATILGLKVIGGKLLGGGRIGAVVEKVKKGSIADNVGRLLPG